MTAKIVNFTDRTPVEQDKLPQTEARKRAIEVVEKLLEELKKGEGNLTSFLFASEEVSRAGNGSTFMLADGSTGVSPEFYLFLQGVMRRIEHGYHEAFFGDDDHGS